MKARRLLASGAFALIGGVCTIARADGGYFSGAKGAHASGRGGAFTARADDVTAVAFNPAGLTHIGATTVQVGNRFSFNERTYKRNPALDWGNPSNGVPRYVEYAEVSNQAPWQVLDPFIGVASSFGLKDWAFAFAVFSPAGTAREVYPADGGQRYMMVRRNAQIIDYNLSAAWKYHEVFGVGASLQWIAVPTLEYGLIIDGDSGVKANPVTSPYDIRATIKGSDLFTLNAILGAWIRPTENLELGLSGQILPSEIKAKGKLAVGFVNPPEGTTINLQRDGSPADDVTLTLPLPMSVRLGARYRHIVDGEERFDVELDGVYETWSQVKNFRLDSNNLFANYREQLVPVGVINVEKQWRDTIGVHLGGDYNLLPKQATVRAGVYYESPVAPAGYSNIDFSDGPQLGGALGASLFFGKLEIALTTEYRAQTTVHVEEKDARVYQAKPASTCVAPYTDAVACSADYPGQPGPPINGGTYDAYSLVASLEGTYRF